MKARRSVRIALLLCCTLMYFAGIPFAQENEPEVQYQVIRLLSEEIVPSITIIQLGTVVIWVNEDCKPTEIQFTNPNGMVIACDGSKSFIPDPERIISQMIPCAGVESLCLVQKGEFTYEVKRESRKLKGTIIVK